MRVWEWVSVAVFGVCGAAGCVTPGQFNARLDAVVDGQMQTQTSMYEVNRKFEMGEITWEQRMEQVNRLLAAQSELVVDQVEGLKADHHANVDKVVSGLKQTAQGASSMGTGEIVGYVVGGLATLLTGGVGVAKAAQKGAVVQVNKERDLQRKMLGEKTVRDLS